MRQIEKEDDILYVTAVYQRGKRFVQHYVYVLQYCYWTKVELEMQNALIQYMYSYHFL